MPLPTTRVIPVSWSEYHAPVARGGMNATVVARAAGTTGWDPVTESRTYVPGAVLYSGPARVQRVDQGYDAEQAEEDVTARNYLVQIDYAAAPVSVGQTLQVTECRNDPQLVTQTVNHRLVVTDVQYGSERFTRDLVCQLNMGGPQ